ncbi:TPA_asm: coat protein [ssRNA phage Gephyllon.1_2]|uniref:Coat protein n=2 Tax=Norzivirales TaxID=2842247 RepID=A0A8S5L3A2_9VIRU|nr:coat protein [ssRNA phage Gephyllon.1_2]QDH90428.1 MAG: hypothetical protein H1BulkLitter4157_000003 [Leviviridae sp.]DAD51900.1 TPA_asm: coat protein [ssRNA phage Gephyllon.1_2]
MAISLTSPITGAAVTGLTSPTYTVAVDTPPNTWSKQWAVTALGGTQTGVDTSSSASRPFTLTAYRPQSLKTLNTVDSTGVVRVVGFNTYGFLVRKGMTPLAGQASKTSQFRLEASIPAGADTADQPNINAATSCTIGALWQQADGIATTLRTGVL